MNLERERIDEVNPRGHYKHMDKRQNIYHSHKLEK